MPHGLIISITSKTSWIHCILIECSFYGLQNISPSEDLQLYVAPLVDPQKLLKDDRLQGPVVQSIVSLTSFIKRSTHEMFYDFITKYSGIFVENISDFFDKIYWKI